MERVRRFDFLAATPIGPDLISPPMNLNRLLSRLPVLVLVVLASCFNARPVKPDGAEGVINSVAEEYVKLVLAVGQHDANYVDAYYGPPS